MIRVKGFLHFSQMNSYVGIANLLLIVGSVILIQRKPRLAVCSYLNVFPLTLLNLYILI